MKTAISLPAKVAQSAVKLVSPDKPGMEDFSSILKTAVVEYLNKHHPGLIEATAVEISAAAKSAVLEAPPADAAKAAAIEKLLPNPPEEIFRQEAAEPPQEPFQIKRKGRRRRARKSTAKATAPKG